MKHTLLITALLWALGASGQIYINSFTFGAAPAANLLLDDYPGAVRAYSLRLLRTAYTGNCVEVRRSSDNTTSNIGFSGGVLDTATLKTFCASTDCFVRTWYDQSTVGANATQTTDANQARIVLNGVVDRRGGNPCLVFDGTDIYTYTGFAPSSLSNWSSYAVFERATTGIGSTIFANSSSNVEDIRWLTTNALRTRIQALMSTTRTETGLLLSSVIRGSSTVLVHLDDVQVNSQATASLSTNTLNRLGGASAAEHNGAMLEAIVWDADWTADRATINTNINSFYNAY